MQQQNVFSYSFSNPDINRKAKTDRKPQKRKKAIDYIDSIYLPKTENKKPN